MNIQKINKQPAFGTKFVKNQAFKEVMSYAEKNGKLPALDASLYILSKANHGDVIIMHGKNIGEKTQYFSNFITLNRKKNQLFNSVENTVKGASSPEEASFNAIIDLAKFGYKFKKLFNVKEPKVFGTADDIIEKYTVSKLI